MMAEISRTNLQNDLYFALDVLDLIVLHTGEYAIYYVGYWPQER